MRYLMICLISFGVTPLLSQKIDPAPPGKSVVYFARPSPMGFAINFSYFDSTKLIGRFNGGKYVRYECNPGRHLFWARSENRVFIEADLEPEKIYFFRASPSMGLVKAQVEMEQADPNDPKQMKNILKLMAKKAGEIFTAERLEKDSKDLENVVERGLAKYKEDRAVGRKLPPFDRTKYYAEPATK
jgi:hypothetical protein